MCVVFYAQVKLIKGVGNIENEVFLAEEIAPHRVYSKPTVKLAKTSKQKNIIKHIPPPPVIRNHGDKKSGTQKA